MITLLVILGVISCAGLVVVVSAVWEAPTGYQDKDGYHLSKSRPGKD
ncbi:MAG TPA: hypothetical protein PKX00_14490 [Opitutaceae bacterium]|jgi:hypothetical protein|nr:hypothetical protein [Opitutaceae bacterium]HRE06817.1 hypothetical protein [Opitutaceae bacterium]